MTPSYTDRSRLKDRGFLVFGAGQGIGLETAIALAEAEARVVCVDNDASRAEAAADRVRGHAIVADVTDAASLAAGVQEGRRWLGGVQGAIDIVGLSKGMWLQDATDDDVQAAFALNLGHVFRLIRILAPLIGEDGGGSLSFVGSVAGVTSIARQGVYGAAKAALHHLVASAAVEFGPSGVRVNAVAPGFVRTPRMLERFTDENWAELVAATPLRRVGEPSDIAGVLLFLASDLSSFITGQTLVVDAGATLPLRIFAQPPGT